jgi:hypothetical protein
MTEPARRLQTMEPVPRRSGVGRREIRLEVQEKFVSACQLYVAFGFITAEPVSFNPVPGTSFPGLCL